MRIIKGFYVMAILSLTAVGFWMADVTTQHEQTDFQVRNVEALANGEDEKTYMCLGEGNVTCPVTGSKVKIVYILNR